MRELVKALGLMATLQLSLLFLPMAFAGAEEVTSPGPAPVVVVPPAEDLIEPPVTGGDGPVVTAPATAPSSAASSDATPNTWAMIITTIVTIVLGWVGNMLRKKWQIDSQREALDATKSLWEQRNFLIDNRIIPFALSTAEHWLLTQIGPIIKDATDGDGFQWATHWSSMKGYVKRRVIKKFAAENVDVIALLGADELDDLVDRLLFKLISKLPPNIQSFIPRNLIDKGTDWASALAVAKGKELLRLDAITE